MKMLQRFSCFKRSTCLFVISLCCHVILFAQDEWPGDNPASSSFQGETRSLFAWCTHKVNQTNECGLLNVHQEDFGVLGARYCPECGTNLPVVVKKNRLDPWFWDNNPDSIEYGSRTLTLPPMCTHPQICTGSTCNFIGGFIAGILASMSLDCVAGYTGSDDCTSQGGCTEPHGCTGSNDCSQGNLCTNQTECSSSNQCTDGIDCSTGNSCTAGQECTSGLKCSSSGEDCTEGPKCSEGENCTAGHTCSQGGDCTSEGKCSQGENCTTGPMCSMLEDCTEGDYCSQGDNCTSGDGLCSYNEDCTNEGACSTGTNCTTAHYCSSSTGCTKWNNCSDGANCTKGFLCPKRKAKPGGKSNKYLGGSMYSIRSTLSRFLSKHGHDISVILLACIVSMILPLVFKALANRNYLVRLYN